MKKIILIIASVALIHTMLLAQGCLPEGITFTTQDQVDNFQINYPGCTVIEGSVIVSAGITNLNGLSVLTSIEGNLVLGEPTGEVGPHIDNLSGLDNLTSIGGDFEIFGCGNLTTLSGIENLTFVGGNLNIGIMSDEIWCYPVPHGNNELFNVSSLNGLTNIGGNLQIIGNDNLTNLSGLDNLISIGGDLWISDNHSLSNCEVQSICDYLAISTAYIANNAPGCNSPEEVLEACFSSLNEISGQINFSIFPNPFNDQAFLSIDTQSKSLLWVYIYNITGICVKSWQFQNQQPGEKEYALDLKDLPAGIYFCRVQLGNEMVTQKLIKY